MKQFFCVVNLSRRFEYDHFRRFLHRRQKLGSELTVRSYLDFCRGKHEI